MKKTVTLLLILAMIFVMAACSATPEDPATFTPPAITYQELGEGANTFYFIVRDQDGSAEGFHIHTDKTVVGDALLELELIEGEHDGTGLYLYSVNGISADWATEGAYWAFYINGEYAMSGVDTTDIQTDAYFELAKTIYEE